MIEQEGQAFMNGQVLDHLIVVQEQEDLSIMLQDLIDEHGQDGRDGRGLRAVQEMKSILAKSREARTQGRDNGGPEARGIIIQLIQRQPGHRTPSLACAVRPGTEQRGFPHPADAERSVRGCIRCGIQSLEQPFTHHQCVWLARE